MLCMWVFLLVEPSIEHNNIVINSVLGEALMINLVTWKGFI